MLALDIKTQPSLPNFPPSLPPEHYQQYNGHTHCGLAQCHPEWRGTDEGGHHTDHQRAEEEAKKAQSDHAEVARKVEGGAGADGGDEQHQKDGDAHAEVN